MFWGTKPVGSGDEERKMKQGMGKVGLRIAAGVGLLLTVSSAGFSQQREQPAAAGQKVDWTAFLPAGEGQFQTAAYCTLCHSVEPMVSNRRADEAGWKQTVETMAYGNNAPIPEEDIPVISKYLARYFGPSTPKLELPIHINSAPKQILLLLASLSEPDVQKILDAREKEKIKDFTALEAIVGSGKLSKYKSVLSFENDSSKCN
jgi:hypothetical protein